MGGEPTPGRPAAGELRSPDPLTAADQPQAPPQLRHALRALDRHVDTYITRARLTPTA